MPGILPPMNQVRDRVGVWLGAKPRSAGVLPPGPPESVGPADFAPRIGQGSTTPAAPAHGPGQLGQPPQGGGQQAAADYAQRRRCPSHQRGPRRAASRAVPPPAAWRPPAAHAWGDGRPGRAGRPADGGALPASAHERRGRTHIHQQPQLVSGHVVYGGVQGGDTHITQHYSTTQQNNQTTQQNYNVTQNVNATQNFNTTLSTQNFNATQNYNVTQNPQTMQPPGSVGDRPVIERIVEVDRPLITERVTVVEKPVDRIVEVEKIVEKPIYIKERRNPST
ncbi:unnamed protein product [Prorocentrum cordatum]|uniref:DUF2382 domain-containing protein n=1 Tax=Prorocentrum cordatum TaxID=2364126 RepID=A0ABN9T656_9DINO|nr:unnamed protein product [Polarella glacialis]